MSKSHSQEPRLAVVIPCYNHANYIGAALESVLGQTRPPEKIIVVDDGSKDDSIEVIRGYEKDGVECTAQENQGAHNTINGLIQRAAEDCDYISILNSDDLYEPERFSHLLPTLKEDPTSQVVCSGLRMINDDSEPLSEGAPRAKWLRAVYSMSQVEDLDLADWLGLANFPISTSNIIGRAEYLKANPFRPYRFNHDYFFLASTVLRGALRYIDEPLLLYRAHNSNTIQTEPAPLLKEMLRMHLDLYHHFAPELKEDEAMRARFYRFTRSSWDSISAFHGGLLQTLLAELLATEVSPERIEQVIDQLEAPELHRFPNTGLVSSHDGKSPLLQGGQLGERINDLKSNVTRAKQEATTLKDLNRLRTRWARSRWMALGALLGVTKKVVGSNDGKTATEKADHLRNAVAGNGWMKIGLAVGLLSDEDFPD